VVGVDLAAMDPPLEERNVVSLVGDLADSHICEHIRNELQGGCHVLLCDAAPKLTGIRDVDRANEERLLLAVEVLIPLLLERDGDLLLKLLEAPEVVAIERRIRPQFAMAKTVKVAATRKGSRERYLLARSFGGAPGPGQ
jgi:23S rRNA (uridine2552-2'-O)-methyltransferase